MVRPLIRIGAATLLAAVIVGAPAQLLAQTANQPATEKPAPARKKDGEPAKQRKLPYAGNLTAIGKTGKNFTVGNRVFHVGPETKFFRGDEAAALTNGVPGEYLTLSYVKSGEGRWIAQNVYFGGKKKDKSGRKKKQDQ